MHHGADCDRATGVPAAPAVPAVPAVPGGERAHDAGAVSEIIRPSAVVPETAARAILAKLTSRDTWMATPSLWSRYDTRVAPDRDGRHHRSRAELIGTIQVAYDTPTRFSITIYRVTVTRYGTAHGWTVESLCNEALGMGGLDLARCPRASLAAPPKPFRF